MFSLLQSDRVVISSTSSSTVIIDGYEYDKNEKTIKISNIQTADTGVYTCTIINHDNQRNERSLSVYVHGM